MGFDFGFEVGGRVVVFCFLYWSSNCIYSKPLLVHKEKSIKDRRKDRFQLFFKVKENVQSRQRKKILTKIIIIGMEPVKLLHETAWNQYQFSQFVMPNEVFYRLKKFEQISKL